MFDRLNIVVIFTIATLGLILAMSMIRSQFQPIRIQSQNTVLLPSANATLTRSRQAQRQVQSRLVTPLNLAALTDGADLIAVGQVVNVEDKGIVYTERYGNPAQANRLITSLRVERVLKGSLDASGADSNLLVFEALMLTSDEITNGIFGVFFLHQTSPQNYTSLDPDNPYVLAKEPVPAIIGGTDLDRVVAEVVQVIESPDVSPNKKYAIYALSGVKTWSATIALRRISQNGDAEHQLRTMAILLHNGDISVLDRFVDIVMRPTQDVPLDKLGNLAGAVKEIKDPRAIAALTRLLRSQDAEIRRNAAMGLRHIGGAAVIAPLSKELDDSDQMARYNAVMGIAEATGEINGAPSIDSFKRDEERYLMHWRERVRKIQH